MNKQMVARRLVCIAKELVASPEDEIKTALTEIELLAEKFKETHGALLNEMTEAEAKFKAYEKQVAETFKFWLDGSGFRKLRLQVLKQADECLAMGTQLESAAGSIALMKRESEQDAWKPKYEILKSTLNPAEKAKYGRYMDLYLAKQITEIKTGVKVLDHQIKSWCAEAQEIADERGVDLGRASSMRSAGIFGTIGDMLKNMARKLVSKVSDVISGIYDRVTGNGRMLSKLRGEVDYLTATLAELRKTI
jgi:hypothetical protein